jgi:hypothetical protein
MLANLMQIDHYTQLTHRMMRPLCGNLTINLQQGPITGLLGEMGLTDREVWKLE